MKTFIRRTMPLFLSLSMAAGSIAFGAESTTEGAADASSGSGAVYEPGTYTGVSMKGKGGELDVEVTFSEDAITDIVIGANNETPSIAELPFSQIPEQIVKNQSLGIDTVTGATLTSTALLEAVADAVTQAGGDAEALKAVPVAAAEEAKHESLEADVVVAGAGAAGLSAALAAASFGADSVIVFEKNSITGGDLRICEGLFATSGLTDDLKAERTEQTDEYLAKIAASEPVDAFEEQIWDTFQSDYQEWLASDTDKVFDSAEFNMIDYGRSDGMGAEAYQTYASNSYEFFPWFVDETGAHFEKAIAAVGFQWPRFTYITGHSADGEGYVNAIEQAIEDRNYPVSIYKSTPVTSLTTDDEGNVTGVVAEASDGTVYEVTAAKGVILATGGYSANGEMMAQYNQWFEGLTSDIKTDNVPTNTGDGILMAQAVGGATANMGSQSLLPITSAVTGRLDSLIGDLDRFVLVNTSGARFVDEGISRLDLTYSILAQEGQMAYIIRDKNTSGIVDGVTNRGAKEEALLATGELYKADSLEDLAAQTGMDPEVLKDAISKFNDACVNGNDEFGRIMMAEKDQLLEAPYYAYPVAPSAHITFGGIVTDNDGHVYREDGSIIGGLYAAGEVCNNSGGIDFAMPQGYVVAKGIVSE